MTVAPQDHPSIDEVRQVLLDIVALTAGGDVLARQLAAARLTVTPTEVLVSPPPGTAAADLPDGPVPARGLVDSPEGEPVGEILVWVQDGLVTSAEHAWYTDDPPTAWPPPRSVTVEG